MLKCEVCGKAADKHHIVYRSQGGVDYELNFKYLCSEHHRGKNGPHKDRNLDLQYKLELQSKIKQLLKNEYYSIDELVQILKINKGMMKRLLKNFKLYKEGYKSSDVIFRLMGCKEYSEEMLYEFCDFIANF
ncbi:MAG: hypothetical protein K0R54_3086 [Clostridiaceae bacterium]|nr:hypothetical protein [Clostridiaceae bacterium]